MSDCQKYLQNNDELKQFFNYKEAEEDAKHMPSADIYSELVQDYCYTYGFNDCKVIQASKKSWYFSARCKKLVGLVLSR